MAQARGANAVLAGAFESTYGTPPGSGYFQLPFSAQNLGAEQDLITDDLLGNGRNPWDPTADVITNDGDVTVPVDLRNFGFWLKLLLGAPVTTATVAAAGKITFSAQPAATSTITLNGTVWTFVASGATGNQIAIGANLAATMTALAAALNASAETQTAKVTYTADATSISLVYDVLGPGGNTYTIATTGNSNGTVSAGTLTGGANKHTFTAGGLTLPSASFEVGLPDLPKYFMNFGFGGNQLKVSLARSGLLNAVISLFGKNEAPATASAAGTPTVMAVERFAQFSGAIKRNGSVLGKVTAADFTYGNDMEKGEDITPTGDIGDLTPGVWSFAGNITSRFADTILFDQATSNQPCALSFGWQINTSKSLVVTASRIFVPRPKKPITGPRGIQMTFAFQTGAGTLTFELTNDVPSY
ncbi:hypothetical protein AEAC466_17370 [Asticcacaulis sp. AC466]|uniref:phage tail tube protein n=1 Tax=Asticcacaulis sp. AC466 TaxID=1282362 RepID=UPI0003C3E52A|nr:phage tail tube protein [Asticcacaulis sp. AC466]ESQ82393.1 hypothetical protein AEAC466_17370 [Asticcacaulis sp. AC466]